MNIWIDNRYFNVKDNYTIFQYCAKIGINLPCFCYHERLSIAGNCRICVVESNNALVVSCATLLLDNMQIFTKSKRIKKAREGVLEFLLVNHPLDCPICDQGGECDLQDILMIYGSDRGRFYELNKRSVTNLNCMGPLVKTVMTRCIHCTRCVRFVNEVSSVFDFGIIGRGALMEIGTYVFNFISDELLGNIIDLCPVGALISMPSSFSGRSWELNYIQSVDILDAFSSNIRLAVANNQIKRIVPSLDEFYDEWITNKIRFVYDSFTNQRLYYPKLRLNSKFIIITWKLALYIYLDLLYNKSKSFIEIYCGPFLSLELSVSLKSFFNSFGCSNFNFLDNQNNLSFDLRYSYLLNISITDFSKIVTILFLALNPRLELPLLNSILRKNYLNNFNFKAYSIGFSLNYLTYPVINLGSSNKYLYKFLLGQVLISNYFLFNDFYNNYFFNTQLYMFFYLFIGNSNILRNDFNFILNSLLYFFFEFKLSITQFNFINKDIGRISYLDLGLSSNIKIKSKLLKNIETFNFLIGVEFINSTIKNFKNFNVYLGSFYSSNFFDNINLILPISIFTEKISSYLNLEGRFRITNKATTPFKFIFLDTQVIESFSVLIRILIYDNFSIISNFYKLIFYFKHIFNFYVNYLINLREYVLIYLNKLFVKNIFFFNTNFFSNIINNSLFSRTVYNFYSSDIFSKKSKVLVIMGYKIKHLAFNNNNNSL